MARKRFTPTPEAFKRLQEHQGAPHPIAAGDELVTHIVSDWTMTSEDAASVIGCSTRTLAKLPVGKLRVGNAVRYSPKTLRSYLQRVLTQ